MMWTAIVLGLAAAGLLLAAGYLIGARKGADARRGLQVLNRNFAKEVARLRELAQQPRGVDESLRSALQDLLSPLVQRERLSIEMARLEGGLGQQRDLTAVLDQMAEKGNFSAVLLCDAQGWRIGASSATQDPERLGATASLLVLLADRLGRDGAPSPLALMVHDTANTTTLCRVFTVGQQRLTLTVVAAGSALTPSAVDPALARLTAMLLNKDAASSDVSESPELASG